jgi:hypothetical protein
MYPPLTLLQRIDGVVASVLEEHPLTSGRISAPTTNPGPLGCPWKYRQQQHTLVHCKARMTVITPLAHERIEHASKESRPLDSPQALSNTISLAGHDNGGCRFELELYVRLRSLEGMCTPGPVVIQFCVRRRRGLSGYANEA